MGLSPNAGAARSTAPALRAEPFFGHRSRQGRVVYIWLEGQAGAPNRLQAWETANGRPFPSGVSFLFDSFKLSDHGDVLGLAASIAAAGGADLIVIDTMNRAAPGLDENTSQDTGRILEAIKQLESMVGGFVLLVHHSGKDQGKGLRGHSSIGAALDAVIEVNRTDDRREWRAQKVKDGEDGEAHSFRLRVVELGEDDDGDMITSCVAESDGNDDGPPIGARPKLPKGGNQRIVYDALGPLLRASRHFGRAGAPPARPCLTMEEATVGVRDRLVVEPKRRTERAQQAIRGLVATHVLGHNEGWIWLA